MSPTKTLSRDPAPIGDEIDQWENLVQMSKQETKKKKNLEKQK